MIDALLGAGARVELALSSGHGELMRASVNGNAAAVKALLRRGVVASAARQRDGSVALTLAAQQSHAEEARVLLAAAGVAVGSTRGGDLTALVLASSKRARRDCARAAGRGRRPAPRRRAWLHSTALTIVTKMNNHPPSLFVRADTAPYAAGPR